VVTFDSGDAMWWQSHYSRKIAILAFQEGTVEPDRSLDLSTHKIDVPLPEPKEVLNQLQAQGAFLCQNKSTGVNSWPVQPWQQ
jgi:hypothetical protein